MKQVFNLGCGPRGGPPLPSAFAGWREVRVDIDESAEPDLIADLCDLSPILSGSADAVWASHCIEHLYVHDVTRALAEIRRILTPEGFAVIRVPDLQEVARFIANDQFDEAVYQSPAGPVTAHDMVYGFKPALEEGRLYMAHRSGFTPSVMIKRFMEAGFSAFGLVRQPGFELVGVASNIAWPDDDVRVQLFGRLGL